MSKVSKFIPNTPDNLHCLQSCFSMVYDTIFNDEISVEVAEQLTNFKPGLPTWQFKALLSFAEKGLKVVNIENFPVELFIEDPISAIRQQFTDEDIANHIIAVSNLEEEKSLVKTALATGCVVFEQRIPSIEDIQNYLQKGWFVICNINYWMLLNEPEKYAGHFVVVENISNDSIVIQNPGLPPIPNQKVTIKDFLSAWQYPDENACNIIAVGEAR